MTNKLQSPSELSSDHSTDVAEFLRILHASGDVYEVRSMKCPERVEGSFYSTAAGWFNTADMAAQAIECIERLKPPAVYVTLNPCKPALLARAANRIQHKVISTTSDVDILRRRSLFIDIDAKRPAGISSTEAELYEAELVSNAIMTALRAEGWPEPLQGMSGNGRYLLYRVDLPNDDASKELIKRVLYGLADRFNSDGAEVDLSTFNASRVLKVLGTVARKGDQLIGVEGCDDRPHRQSYFIRPSGELAVVPIELLQRIASDTTNEPEARQETTGRPDVIERARKYLAKMSPSIDGEKGSGRAYAAACAMVMGFDLSIDDAYELLVAEFNPRCVPQWSEKELRHKVEDASKVSGKRGYLVRTGPFVASVEQVNSADEPWPQAVSIERPRVPAFPMATLPEPLRSWVAAMAEACQVPADLPGLLALAVCAGACARRVVINAGRNWIETINLYVAVLLDPANRKSAVFSAAMKPLRLIERELIENAAPELARSETDRRIKEAQLKKLETKAAGGDLDALHAAHSLAEELSSMPVPAMPKLVVDDVTPEACEMELAAQGGRLIVAGCEGGIYDVIGGRYSSGVANIDCFLKAHAGDDLRVDRVTRGSIVIDRCCLTLAYAVQPDVVRSMAERPSFRGRGLIGRFLFAIPESRLGSRQINPEPVPAVVNARYEELVRRLAAIPEPPEMPCVIRLDSVAAERFRSWQREVEGWLADDGRLRELKDWGGKLCGLTARLAAIMHLVQTDRPEPWEVPVSLPVIESAIELARWSVDHAEAVILGLMSGSDGPLDDAAYLMRWIRDRAFVEFSRRDAQVHGRSRFDGEPRRLDAALELLVDHAWIRPLPMPPTTAGRPPSTRFAVRPDLCGGRTIPPARDSGVI